MEDESDSNNKFAEKGAVLLTIAQKNANFLEHAYGKSEKHC